MKNKWTVAISGMPITLHTDYDQAYVDSLAQEASDRLEGIRKASKYDSKLDAALLMLIDLLDSNKKMEAELSKTKKDLESNKLDLEILKIENEKLNGKQKA